MYPLACVMVVIVPEPFALIGSAWYSLFFWVTLTRMKVFLPSAEAVLRVMVAVTVGLCSVFGMPSILLISGLANTSKPKIAATGLPERITTGFPFIAASAVGIAGLMAMPWMITPGFPALFTASGTRSSPPTLVPPVVITASAFVRAVLIFSVMAFVSSLVMPMSIGSAFSSRVIAAIVVLLAS